jgi:hypothetical protein
VIAQTEYGWGTTALWWWRWVPINGGGYGVWEYLCLNGPAPAGVCDGEQEA